MFQRTIFSHTKTRISKIMLELNSISKSFSEKKILDSISLNFDYGITGIAGSNGCGKTTMLKILTGLLKYDGGTIIFNSQQINPQSSFWRNKIGYLPQAIGLYNRMTVYDLLDYMLVLSNINDKKTRREKIEYLSNELNLKDYLNVYCGNLSGGVKQRVGIAQAVIHEPEIIFLDEPTNNLDSEERERFHDFLGKIKQNKIILYVGHILGEMSSISNQVVIFKNGKIAFEGTPSKLLNQSGYVVKQVLLDEKDQYSNIKSKDILRKIQENGKLRIIYNAALNDQIGEPVELQFEDVYKIITRD